ncbi:G-type lectin S-receptor-like serine/threonine-protein kinase LECRK2 [Eucalyptus grandis]|uniref:G-type lectin S-receptor-like serine/threonine-protein kinase LECRK2 n=1 Tax=Eucalyptus grandis TaxID=71139 RepID=UPI00192E7EE7|nr:G-type lectin S-receptor-like serine/threonine-protein kinase LECRK2 [Eucalyptus grandis]
MASVILGILLVLTPLPLSTEAQTRGNLTFGNSLTANDRNSSLLSPSGKFAFRFRKMGQGAHLLAIWFEMIKEKTIVWSANGDNLAPEGSKVQLTTNRGLVLTDPRGRELWSSNLTATGLPYAAMLDTGNFILASASHVNLWDSFSRPTDTLLPTQQLNLGAVFRACYSEMNYSAGRFLFGLQPDGNLATNTFIGFRLIFNQSGRVYLTDRNGVILNIVTSDEFPTIGFYRRAILEYDGVFRKYAHPSTADSSSGWAMGWLMVSSPVPPNICTSIHRENGTRACGFNSYCTLGDDQIQRPRCQCAPGYSMLDSTNEMNGCRQDFISQSCDGSRPEKASLLCVTCSIQTGRSLIMRLAQRKPRTGAETFLADCHCAVAVFKDGKCQKKKAPLLNGRMDPSVGGKALIKVQINNSTSKSTGNGNKNSALIIIGSGLLSSSVFVNLLLLLLTYYRSFRSRDSKLSQRVQINQATGTQTFTY